MLNPYFFYHTRMRHHLLPCLLMLVVAASQLRAQAAAPDEPMDEYGDRLSTKMLSVGLGVAGGVTMSLDPPTNWKVKPVLGWNAGLHASYPLTPIVKAGLNLGIENRGTKYHWHDDSRLWEIRQVNYFTISPGFMFDALYLGMNIGLPMGGKRSWQTSAEDRERTAEIDADADSLVVMLEPRLGAVVPLMDEEVGWLGLTVMAGYNLSNLSDNNDFLPAEYRAQERSTATPSFMLGVTWQFGIPGTEKTPITTTGGGE